MNVTLQGKSSCIFEKIPSNTSNIKFVLKPNIKFHFYTSHTPCGDASIFHRKIKQKVLIKLQSQTQQSKIEKDFIKKRKLGNGESGSLENVEKMIKKPIIESGLNEVVNSCERKNVNDIEISSEESGDEDNCQVVEDFHRTGAKILPASSRQDPKGVGGPEYQYTGVVRTKPGRGDPTYSMSCSDKIAKWNVVGWEVSCLSECQYTEDIKKRKLVYLKISVVYSKLVKLV